MARKIVIATHGKVADGFKDAIDIIVGNGHDVVTINAFSEDETPKDTIAKLMANTDPKEELLVFTDMMSGSVNQMFIPYLSTHNLFVVTGTNLPLLCQLVLNFDETLTEEAIMLAIELAREEIKFVNSQVRDNAAEQADIVKDTDSFFDAV
ncbi:hypothetical protein LJC55_02455 [Eubacteriales bacterium OttesenSCG-928-N14]|nr:hypothetical protein [Eubacteriales bacterium OttesenSCG-928-N14]